MSARTTWALDCPWDAAWRAAFSMATRLISLVVPTRGGVRNECCQTTLQGNEIDANRALRCSANLMSNRASIGLAATETDLIAEQNSS
jgi:hypothetical protein